MIFKLQISDRTGAAVEQVLIYDEQRNYMGEFDLTSELREMVGYKGGMFKEFWYGELCKGAPSIQLTRKAPWQDW